MPPEIPEHLLARSRERRRQLGLPVPGEEPGEATEAPAGDAPAGEAPEVEAPAAEAGVPAAAAEAGPPAEDVETASGAKIPAHLLERSRRRRAAVAGGDAGEGVAAAAGAGAAAAAATATLPAPTSTGPGGHTQRLLTVVKSGSIQQTRAPRPRTRSTPGPTSSWWSSRRS
jgi:hypothetical protein